MAIIIKKKSFIALFLIILLILMGAAGYLTFTAAGSRALAQFMLSRYFRPEDISIQSTEGNLWQAMAFKDLVLDNVQWLPPGSTVRMQRLDVRFSPLNPKDAAVAIDNARIKIPDYEPILVYGNYREGNLNFFLYCKYIDPGNILALFDQGGALKNISGIISDLDIRAQGPLLRPQLSGTLLITELAKDSFSLANCPVSFAITIEDIQDNFKAFGEIKLQAGEVAKPRSAKIALASSKIILFGDPKTPSFDLKGTSVVEGTKIEITLKGTKDKPDLQLKSEPPLPQERLLLMLATGKSWQKTEESLTQGKVSAELARDFVDYFFFSGSASRIAQRFGIDEVTFKYDSQTKGFGVKKSISEKIEASYGLEQSQDNKEAPSTTHKLGGAYKVTETISVGAEQELKQDKANSQEGQKGPGKVLLKYEKEF